MSRNGRLAGLFVLAGAFVVSSVIGIETINTLGIHKKRQVMNTWVKKNLERVIEEQEEKLGIQHIGRPNIVYNRREGSEKRGTIGSYEVEEDTIWLCPRALNCRPEATENRIENTLRHELGHFYLDKLNERLGRGNWPTYKGLSKEEKIGITFVSEGMAEWCERKLSGEKDHFEGKPWPTDIKEFGTTYIKYSGGYHFVKPLLDEHGVQAMITLSEQPPTPKELKNLPKYKEKILSQLKKTKK